MHFLVGKGHYKGMHYNTVVSLGLSLLVRQLKMLDDSLVVLEPRLVACNDREHAEENKAQALWAKRMSRSERGVKEEIYRSERGERSGASNYT